jgi:hypothetical protein
MTNSYMGRLIRAQLLYPLSNRRLATTFDAASWHFCESCKAGVIAGAFVIDAEALNFAMIEHATEHGWG